MNKLPTALPASGRIEICARANKSDAAELIIFGNIGPSLWDEPSIAAKDVVEQLSTLDAQTIMVRINSYGGSCTDGISIFNALKRHPARITVSIEGVAASIASLMAMAGDHIEMAVGAQMMIHAPWAHRVTGSAKQLDGHVEELRRMEAIMAEIYADRSKQSVEAILAIFHDGEDHWFSAAEAVKAGFADAAIETTATATARAMAAIRDEPSFARFASRMPQPAAAALHFSYPPGPAARTGDSAMPAPRETDSVDAQAAARAAASEALAAERHRAQQILTTGSQYQNNQAMAQLVTRAVNEGMSFEDFGQRALAVLGSGRESLSGGGFVTNMQGSDGRSSRSDFVEAASDVLAMRAGVRIEKPHAGVRDINSMSLGAIAEACLSRSDREMAGSAAAAIRAAMTTSDFPSILEYSIRKSVRQGYEQEPSSHRSWIRTSTTPDFKPMSRVILGSMPELAQVPELGEYTAGAIDEDKSVPFKVDKYGRLISISWEALVNDDLNALGRIPQGLGQAARRKEADLVYALFASNGQLMQDGLALFHTTHSNLAPPAATLTEQALAAGRLLMRKQTALGGGVLNLEPRVLLVPPELESDAEKLLAATTVHVANSSEVVTPAWIRGLQLVVEGRLPPTGAYLLASPQQIDTAELAFLEENKSGPMIEEESEFARDVRRWKVRHVMGARFLDWRGITKLPIGA